MCVRLSLLTLIASAGVCSGQFFSESLLTRLQGFGFRPAASRSMFMSSVSLEEGSDGEVHKRVHQLSTNKIQDGATVKRSQTELLCADGDCHKKTLRGSSAWVPSNDGSWHKEVHREHKETHRVDDILQHQSHSSMDCIDGVCRHQASRISRLSHAAGMIPMRLRQILACAMGTRINPVIGPAVPAPMEAQEAQAPHVVHLVPLFRRVVPLSWRRAAPLMVVRTKGPTDLQAVAPPVQEGQPLDDLFSLYILSVAVFSTALIAAAALKFFGRRSEARELPLGEPLFPHAGVAAARMSLPTVFEEPSPQEKTVPGATTDLAAAQDYLPRLYQKASSLADARLVRAYLTRVYAAQA
jgi:hypothetical protein